MNTKKIIILAIAVILIASIVFAGFNEDTDISVTGLQYSSQAWGDYNNDGNPDLAICGSDSGGDILTKLYILNIDLKIIIKVIVMYLIINACIYIY